MIAKKLKSLRIDVLIMAGGMAACSFSIPLVNLILIALAWE
jgi:uncharacterized protein involved in cysteine biosynthesis